MKMPAQSTLRVRSRFRGAPLVPSEQVVLSDCWPEGRRRDSDLLGNCRRVGYGCEVCINGQWVCDGYCTGTTTCYGC